MSSFDYCAKCGKLINMYDPIHDCIEARVCSICGASITLDRLTCCDDCHEKAVDYIEREFGVYKKVIDAVSGKSYKVPVRDIIEKGLKQPDLVNYPAWVIEFD